MSRVDQTASAMRLMLGMLAENERKQVLNLVTAEQAQQEEISKMYTDKEIADRYKVHIRTARRWISSGQLKGCQINSKWYSRADWLDDYERAHQVKGG